MLDSYRELLDAAIQHLEQLKSGGEKWLSVQTDTLARLSVPAPQRTTGVAQVARPTPIAQGRGTAHIQVPPPNSAASTSDSQPPAVPLMGTSRAAAWTELRQRALVCEKCPHLARSRKNVVFGVGDVDSPLMFVGEAPGADEDAQGEPFVGAAGQLLTKIIKAMGYSRETVYIANVLKCRPDTPGQTSGNRKPTPSEMKTCLPYLLEQIRIITPKVIVALGATAMEGLLGRPIAISKLRGQWHSFDGTPLMPTYHPSYLLRNQARNVKREVWEDMLQVLEKLGASITEKQRNFFK